MGGLMECLCNGGENLTWHDCLNNILRLGDGDY